MHHIFCPEVYVFHIVYNFVPVALFFINCTYSLLLLKAFLETLLSPFEGSPENLNLLSQYGY